MLFDINVFGDSICFMFIMAITMNNSSIILHIYTFLLNTIQFLNDVVLISSYSVEINDIRYRYTHPKNDYEHNF